MLYLYLFLEPSIMVPKVPNVQEMQQVATFNKLLTNLLDIICMKKTQTIKKGQEKW